jgi:thiol-disulfide isomerase/thioredoxin
MSSIVNNFQQKLSELTLTPFLYLVAAILFIVLALCFYYYYVKPNYLEPTYTANKEHLKETSKLAELLFFYASWCPHSKVAKPIFDDLKASLENTPINGYEVTYTLVDCSSETDEVEQMTSKYSVEGYPTFKLQKDGKIIEYDAKPSRETLEQFLNTVL